MVVKTKINGKPALLDQGLADNIYFWKIQVPVLVTYLLPNNTTVKSIMMNMLIIRCSNPSGVCIQQLSETSQK